MSHSTSLKPVLDFLGQLKENNNRPWFEEHRAAYEDAKERFEALVDRLIGDLRSVEDLGGLTAKDCMMRIYRDIRFSKDKSPYRTNMAASIAPGGRKSTRQAYYFHLEPHDQSMIAGGLYMPEPAQLARFRAAIDHDAAAFKAIVDEKEFRDYFGAVGGERVKTAPQGYARDHPDIELLRLKQVVVSHRLADEKVLSAGFVAHANKTFVAMKPFLDYLNTIG